MYDRQTERMSLSGTEFVAAAPARAGTRWLSVAVRLGVSCGLLFCLHLVVVQAIAHWHFRRGTAKELAEAIRWDPGNAVFYAARAHALEASLDAGDINEVIPLYETATQLSPNHAAYWTDLGGAYEWAGRETDARSAYERARQLFPNSPGINWKLGNFYLRAGQTHEALAAFQTTIRGDPAMRRPVFDLVWRAEIDAQAILNEMIPADTAVGLDYLNYLVESKRLDEAGRLWTRLLAPGNEIEPQPVFPYLDALLQQQRGDEARAAWAVLIGRSRRVFRERSFDGNLVTNGSFEGDILNGGLDWRLYPCDGVSARVDPITFFEGTRSLQLHFDGTQNVAYSHLFQFVPVKPDTLYRFDAYFRAEGISSDSGPRWEIYDAGEKSRLAVATDPALGTASWSMLQLQFKTGPETRILIVRLARPSSLAFDGRIAGTLWLDRIRLHAID